MSRSLTTCKNFYSLASWAPKSTFRDRSCRHSVASTMPKATKKRKQKAADFSKAKLKLGKGKQVASNVIDTSFKARCTPNSLACLVESS